MIKWSNNKIIKWSNDQMIKRSNDQTTKLIFAWFTSTREVCFCHVLLILFHRAVQCTTSSPKKSKLLLVRMVLLVSDEGSYTENLEWKYYLVTDNSVRYFTIFLNIITFKIPFPIVCFGSFQVFRYFEAANSWIICSNVLEYFKVFF